MSMRDEIEHTYDHVYCEIEQLLQKTIALTDMNPSTEEEKEKIVRLEIALQAARDILENMMTPGRKLHFIYEKASVTVEMEDK